MAKIYIEWWYEHWNPLTGKAEVDSDWLAAQARALAEAEAAMTTTHLQHAAPKEESWRDRAINDPVFW